MTTDNQKPKTTLSKRKRLGFMLGIFLMPVLLLILLEIGLTLGNYGGELDLFIKQKNGSGYEYVLNPNVTKRYFFKKGINTPSPNSQTFSAEKDSSTYRIFCLGASTTQGFPYPPSAAFPAMLKRVLSSVYAQKNFEVINCGITAIASHSVLDMSHEILEKYQPDLLVLYTGHNEFYGALGQASRLALFENRTMVRGFLKLQQSRLFLLLRNAIVKIFGSSLTRESVIDHATLMGTVVKEANIRRDSPLFERTLSHFKNNLHEIIEDAKRHNTDIMVSTLASNMDLEPFASFHSEAFVEKDTTAWHQIVMEAEALRAAGKFQEAANKYLAALAMDSSYADVHFRLGKCYQAIEEHSLAQKHLKLAKDFDPVRFRAPSVFNDVIREAGNKYQIPIVDVEEDFRSDSPGGIIGHNLILEHVHPNQFGYFRIGKAVARKISEAKILSGAWEWEKSLTDSAYLSMSRLTILDHELVNYRVFRLTSHWPFQASPDRSYTRVGSERTEQLAKALVEDEGSSLVKAHLDLGFEFYNQNDLDNALAEYLAALEIEPACETYNRIGLLHARKTEIASRRIKDYEAAADNFNDALSFYEQGLKSCPDYVGLNFNLGLLFALRNDHLEKATAYFQKVLDTEPLHKNAMIQLGQIYIRQNNYEKAESFLLQARSNFPNESEFSKDLGVVYARMENLHEAKTCLEKAIALNPTDTFAKHYLNQVNAKIRDQKKLSSTPFN